MLDGWLRLRIGFLRACSVASLLVNVCTFATQSVASAVRIVMPVGETLALARYFLAKKKLKLPNNLTKDEKYCYEALSHVSRSFNAVILQLNSELRNPICIYYLVCRALDTIEDDMCIPLRLKLNELINFPDKLSRPGWKCLEDYGAQSFYEMDLLHNFNRVIAVFDTLDKKYQDPIVQSAKEMARGMAEFQTKKIESVEDYDIYCYYVAGIVGRGLSRIWVESGMEPKLAAEDVFPSLKLPQDNELPLVRLRDRAGLAVSMGLFLQKTNIIRDYREDTEQEPPRVFYPKQIWSKYAESIHDFKEKQHASAALWCLNELVTDAVTHIPDCLEYLSRISTEAVFKFCAIPQVMAIATLERCYNNYNVFTGVVKIRKGEAAKILMETVDFMSALNQYETRLGYLQSRIPSEDPNRAAMYNASSCALDKVRYWKHSFSLRDHKDTHGYQKPLQLDDSRAGG